MTDPSYLSCVALHGFKMVAKLFDRGKEDWIRVDLINVHVSNVTIIRSAVVPGHTSLKRLSSFFTSSLNSALTASSALDSSSCFRTG